MAKIALTLSYDGAHYQGWQRQRHANSIQEHVELAISAIANEAIVVHCAGRTDKGVHATKQVVHFETTAERKMDAWLLGINAHLPKDIRINDVTTVPDHFNARFSATARQYCYVIYENPIAPALLYQGLTWVRKPLDVVAMNQAIQCLYGEHDFSAFRASQCQSKSCHRNVLYADVKRLGPFVTVNIKANAFLYHMVRNIVGSLLTIGEGEASSQWLSELLINRDRTKASATAKPNGLYLVDVSYPTEFGLKHEVNYPIFLPQGELVGSNSQ